MARPGHVVRDRAVLTSSTTVARLAPPGAASCYDSRRRPFLAPQGAVEQTVAPGQLRGKQADTPQL